jgi:nucleoside-diphosphate-sugar epimerase
MSHSPAGLDGRRVLVSGASGFIGQPVVAELVRRGAEVHALSTRPAPAPAEALGASWHRVDLADDAAVEALMGELAPERLVHLAWYTAHGRFWRAQENLTWVGISLRLMRAFVHHGGSRLLMLGSCAEYDWSAADRPLSEADTRLAPATLYGAAKDALRRVAVAYCAQEQVELAWGRPFLMYGPREAPARLVPSVIRSLLAGEVVEIADGERVRDLMHVEDVAGAVVALLAGDVAGEVNIASGVAVKLGEAVDRIARAAGRPVSIAPRALPRAPGEPPMLVADVARLRDEVGYRPRWALPDGLEATVRWWEADGGLSGGLPRVHPAAQRQRIAKADAPVDRVRGR